MQDYTNIGLSSNLQSLTGPVSQTNPTGDRLKEYIDNSIGEILRPGGINYTNIVSSGRTYTAIVDTSNIGGAFTDIQDAINYVNSLGGGTVFIKAGTYVLSSALSCYSKIHLVGEDRDSTIIDFNALAIGLSFPNNNATQFEISNLTIQNSTTTGINIGTGGIFLINNVLVNSCNIGILLGTTTNGIILNSVSQNNTSHGFSLTTGGNIFFMNSKASSNGGDGFRINPSSGATNITFLSCGADNNTSHGFNVLAGIIELIGCISNSNTGTGFINSGATANQLSQILLSCYSYSNGTNFNWIGSSGSNIDNSTRTERNIKYMKNTSGDSLALGDVVILKSAANGDEITTTTTGGDNKVFGMVLESITNNSYGHVLVEGFTVDLKVNGTTDIAIGDYLTPFTTAKIAQKATTGNMVFAIALEAYTTDDSNGVIDALLINPRLI